jgi:hypothetical protein
MGCNCGGQPATWPAQAQSAQQRPAEAAPQGSFYGPAVAKWKPKAAK